MLTVDEAGSAFERLLAATKFDLFKAEVLQDYSAIDDGPSLRAWIAGERGLARELIAADMADWLAITKALTIPITRVHVIEEPLTPYMEWEIDCTYKHSIIPARTERVLLANRTEVADPLPAGDFWIFDSATVLEWIYEPPTNKLAGAMLYEAEQDVASYLDARDRMMKVAEELS